MMLLGTGRHVYKYMNADKYVEKNKSGLTKESGFSIITLIRTITSQLGDVAVVSTDSAGFLNGFNQPA